MAKKIIVFDFDKTLTYNDTIFSFYYHISDKNIYFFIKCIFYFFAAVLYKLKILSNYSLKKIGVFLFLRNISFSSLRKSSRSFVTSIKFNKLFKKYNFENPNEKIYIVSASFEIYLKMIFGKSVEVIGSKLNIYNGKVKSLKHNLFGLEKVKFLKNININKIDILYTDSLSDLPLAKISNSIVLLRGDSKRIFNNHTELINSNKCFTK